MNQVEVGRFIAECRKEKELTQMQLAEMLNITNRAVSKWETGKSMPDTAVMLELCDILGITVNELLRGERISMENYKEKAEETLIELQNKKMKAEMSALKMAIAWLAICIIGVPIHLAINYYYPENNGTGVGTVLILSGIVIFIIHFRKYYEIKLK